MTLARLCIGIALLAFLASIQMATAVEAVAAKDERVILSPAPEACSADQQPQGLRGPARTSFPVPHPLHWPAADDVRRRRIALG